MYGRLAASEDGVAITRLALEGVNVAQLVVFGSSILHDHITVSASHLCGIVRLSTRLTVVIQTLDELAVILSRLSR